MYSLLQLQGHIHFQIYLKQSAHPVEIRCSSLLPCFLLSSPPSALAPPSTQLALLAALANGRARGDFAILNGWRGYHGMVRR